MDLFRQAENLVYRYAELIDEGDFDGLGALFARGNIHFVPGGLSLRGASEVTDFYQKTVIVDASSGTPGTTHWTSNVIVQGDDQGLLARSRYQVTLNAGDVAPRLIATGRYFDHFSVEEGRVHFSQRRIISEYMGDTTGHLHQRFSITAANRSHHDLSQL